MPPPQKKINCMYVNVHDMIKLFLEYSCKRLVLMNKVIHTLQNISCLYILQFKKNVLCHFRSYDCATMYQWSDDHVKPMVH